MRARITPGGTLSGTVVVPGDKSIAHRWLILASTARGNSRLMALPGSLDVRSTAACLARVLPRARPALDAWARNDPPSLKGPGSTWNREDPDALMSALEVEGDGRDELVQPDGRLDCGNSGTSMRLLAGELAAAPFRSVLVGDESLNRRPMERVAEPLRRMGASVTTTEGHAPLIVEGGSLHGISYQPEVPTAQVKGAVLLAGLCAEGLTEVVEPVPTRDHTERALLALGAPVTTVEGRIRISRFQHEGFASRVPGDPSSAAFLVAAAALTGSELTIGGLGLNPTRLHFLRVMERMGVRTEIRVEREELGEPVGDLHVLPARGIHPVRVDDKELPQVIDEIPVLASLAVHAPGDSWFLGAGELRFKETDRLAAVAGGIRSLGGDAGDEGSDLVVAGGGLRGGVAAAGGDHRMAMGLTIAALAAASPCEVRGVEAAEVSFPGFIETLRALGAAVEAA